MGIISKQITEINSNDISLSSFKIKKELNQKFWPNGKLNSRVRLRLMDIADDFIQELSVDWVKPKDIILTGSIANYNWSRFSDVDIHILIDFKKVYPKNNDFVNDYFKAKKENWLAVHEDLKIFGFPIEISVENSNEDNPSSGRYSLYKNKWIVEPNDFQDVSINQELVKRKAADFMTQIDELENGLNSETDKKKCEKFGNKAYKIFDKLKNMRSDGLESDKKEMSSGNIIYKIIRRTGYLDKIWEIVNSSYDKVNSLNERKRISEAIFRGESFSAGIIPFRMNEKGNTEVFLGFPGQPKAKGFQPPQWMNRWQIMKGCVEMGEDPKECAIREFCEESGVSPKIINSKQLISLGDEVMQGGRKFICYGLDLTNDTKFNKTNFHSNMIDTKHYIDLNGGKPYPEIEKYSWKEINNIGGSAPYEMSLYSKCDKICQNRYSSPKKETKAIIISDKQQNSLKESIVSNDETDDVNCIVQSIIEELKNCTIESEGEFNYFEGNVMITSSSEEEIEIQFRIYLLSNEQSKDDIIDSGIDLSSHCSADYPYIEINTYSYDLRNQRNLKDLIDRLYNTVGHEFHHDYQHSNSEKYVEGDSLHNDELYRIVDDNMNNQDETIRDIAQALYYTFKTEEDAFAAGLYQMMTNNPQKYKDYTFEQVLSEYKPYDEMQEIIYWFHQFNGNGKNDGKLSHYLYNTFGLTSSQIFSKLKTAEIRHKKKAYKVYTKFKMHMNNL